MLIMGLPYSFPRSAWEHTSATLRVATLIEPSSTNNLMGRTRYRFGEQSLPHFLTCTVVGWLPVFTRPDTVQILLDSWQFLQEHNRLVLLGYVVLENHIHFIASADNLAKEVMRLTGGIPAPGITRGWSRWSMWQPTGNRSNACDAERR